MQINPLFIFAHPVKTLQDAIEKPDFNKAFFIVMIPTILFVSFNLLAGLKLDMFTVARHAGLHYLSWIIASSVFYFFAFLVAGKTIKGKFLSIMCALSYLWIFLAIMMLVSFLLLMGSPKFIEIQQIVRKKSLTADEVETLYNILTRNDSEALENFEKVHDIRTDLSKYMLTKEEVATINNISAFGFISGTILLFYMLFLYPFITLKLLVKKGSAAVFILYIIAGTVTLYTISAPFKLF